MPILNISQLPQKNDDYWTLAARQAAAVSAMRVSAVGSFTGKYTLGSTASISRGTSKTRHVCAAKATGIRIAYCLGSAVTLPPLSEAAFANRVEMKASIETASGNLVPVHFNARRVTLWNPASMLISDPVDIWLSPGEVFWVRTFVHRLKSDTYSSGGQVGQMTADVAQWPYNDQSAGTAFATGEGNSYDNLTGVDPFASDFTDSGVVAQNNALTLRPFAILGERASISARSVCLLGDSILMGTGDVRRYLYSFASPTKFEGQGWAVRALGDTYPIVQCSIGSERVQYMVDTYNYNFIHRMRAAKWCDAVLIAFGNNDYTNSRTAAQIKADLATLISRVADFGKIPILATILARTSSTDFWKTAGAQTALGSLAAVSEVNDWIRGGPSNVGVLDCTGAMQNGSGLWLGPEAADVSSTTAAGSSSTVIQCTGLTANVHSGKVLKIGAEAITIESNTTTTITVKSAFSGAPGTGVAFEVIDAKTYDGVHPTPRGHAEMAAAIQSQLIALLA